MIRKIVKQYLLLFYHELDKVFIGEPWKIKSSMIEKSSWRESWLWVELSNPAYVHNGEMLYAAKDKACNS